MWASGAYGYLFDYLLWWGVLVSLFVHTWCFFKLFPRKKYRKTGLVFGNVLVMFCMLGVVAMAMETHIRFALVETDSFGVSLPARRWFALNTSLNSLGCRDKEWSVVKPPGVRRIAFVGDSFTYGWGIAHPQDRFTDLLQARFDKRRLGAVEILNVAKPGWNTGDELLPIRDITTWYDVDEVVLCYVPNDIEGLAKKSEDFDPTKPPEVTLFNLDSSCVVDYFYRRIILPRLPAVRGFQDWLADAYADGPTLNRHLQQFAEIKRECDEAGADLRVVLLPFIKTSGKKLDLTKLYAKLGSSLDSIRVEHANLLPAIQGVSSSDLMVNTADAHPNEEAHRRFAQAIWSAFYAEDDQ